jgi:hypothetical protein
MLQLEHPGGMLTFSITKLESGQNMVDYSPDLINKKLQWGVMQSLDEMLYGVRLATVSKSKITPLKKEKIYT